MLWLYMLDCVRCNGYVNLKDVAAAKKTFVNNLAWA